MTTIHHINCGTLIVPNFPTVTCHCLLLEDKSGLALVDTGIGLLDVRNPVERLGQQLIDMAGFQFHEHDTAVRRIEQLSLSPSDVRHIILTHADPDHAGGLAVFPHATVHIAQEELANLSSGNARYIPNHFSHSPRWETHAPTEREWFGLPARPLDLGFSAEVLLIPLFGHTHGHCGVAIRNKDRWLLHVGDAYYLRAELTDENHPVSTLATLRADNDPLRQSTLQKLRRLSLNHADQITLVGYHDITEFTDLPLELL